MPLHVVGTTHPRMSLFHTNNQICHHLFVSVAGSLPVASSLGAMRISPMKVLGKDEL